MSFQVLPQSKNERRKLLQKTNTRSNKFEINFIKFVLIIICKNWKFILKQLVTS